MTDQDLLEKKLEEVTNELCSDYPGIEKAEPWERLYALEQSYRGVSLACEDLHKIIDRLRIRCGISVDEMIEQCF